MTAQEPRPAPPGRSGRAVQRVETALLALTLGGMIILAAGQIVLRNFWGGGLAWADEALRIMVLWVTMLGAIAASREQRHVSIDALARYLPTGFRHATAVFVNVLAALVCVVLAWYSGLFVADSWSAGDRILGGELPAWAAQVILPVAFAAIAYRYAMAALYGVLGRRDGLPRP